MNANNPPVFASSAILTSPRRSKVLWSACLNVWHIHSHISKNRESKLTCYLWRWFSSPLAAICCVLLVLWMMSFLSHNGQRWCRYCVSTKYSPHGSTAEMFSILRCLVTCCNTTAATSNYVTVHYLCMKLRFPFTLFLALYCNHW